MSTKVFFLYALIFLLCFTNEHIYCQNEQSKWYFGGLNALDFLTDPPTILNNNSLLAVNGCASQADANGNLLFYTEGVTVKNASHVTMANGTGLGGIGAAVQPCLIAPLPGSSNIYYIFTVAGYYWGGGLQYSIVDMSLAAGMGSVTVKNVTLNAGPLDSKISGTRHCNGRDFWILVRERNSHSYSSYLLTANGLNANPVISNFTTPPTVEYQTGMKLSPSGNKLAAVSEFSPNSLFTLCIYDFDNTTGVLSNFQPLSPTIAEANSSPEFSIDGSKVYVGENNYSSQAYLHQWDLCAGDLSAIIASHYAIPTTPAPGMQLAINGKIYVSESGFNSLGLINNPNGAGASCNYVPNGQSLGASISTNALPNFINRYQTATPTIASAPAPGIACHAMTFTALTVPNTCASTNFSITSYAWNFGDPLSGFLNTSSGGATSHVFSNAGSYTVTLIVNYKCGSDTVKQSVVIPPPDIMVNWISHCNNTASGTVTASGGIGPYAYTWQPGGMTSAIVSSISPGNYTVSVFDPGLGCLVSTVVNIPGKTAPVLSFAPSDKITLCAGTASVIQMNGNAQAYTWQPLQSLSLNGNDLTISSSGSQIYTLTGTLDGCSTTKTLDVRVVSSPTPQITFATASVCINGTLSMSAQGGNIYQWNGPEGFSSDAPAFSIIMNENRFGSYSLTVTDLVGCKSISVVPVSLVSPPGGELSGIVAEGCAPLCGHYVFKPHHNNQHILSQWFLNGATYSSSFSHCLKVPGVYNIFGNLNDTLTQCRNTLTYTIKVLPKPDAAFITDPQEIEESEEIKFSNTSSGNEQISWTWHFYGDKNLPEVLSSSGERTFNRFTEPGIYTAALVVATHEGCSDTITKKLVVHERCNLFVPNAFTPNGDERNDVFLPVTSGVQTFQLRIFNRWNELLFESNDRNSGWDGTFKGLPVKQDVYIWSVSLKFRDGSSKTTQGHVSLLR